MTTPLTAAELAVYAQTAAKYPDGDCARVLATIAALERDLEERKALDPLLRATIDRLDRERERAVKDMEGMRRSARSLLHSLGEYVRQSMHSNPEWRAGIVAVESALASAQPASSEPESSYTGVCMKCGKEGTGPEPLGQFIICADCRKPASGAVPVSELRAWLESERARLMAASAEQFALRESKRAAGKPSNSTWPEFHDGQAEGVRHVLLWLDRAAAEQRAEAARG